MIVACMPSERGSFSHETVVYTLWKAAQLADELILHCKTNACFTPFVASSPTPEECVPGSSLFELSLLSKACLA